MLWGYARVAAAAAAEGLTLDVLRTTHGIVPLGQHSILHLF